MSSFCYIILPPALCTSPEYLCTLIMAVNSHGKRILKRERWWTSYWEGWMKPRISSLSWPFHCRIALALVSSAILGTQLTWKWNKSTRFTPTFGRLHRPGTLQLLRTPMDQKWFPVQLVPKWLLQIFPVQIVRVIQLLQIFLWQEFEGWLRLSSVALTNKK